MAAHKIMTKVPEYPRPHNFEYNFAMPIESAANRLATMCPIITYDEGLGAMSAYESNPDNAAFVEANTDHCFPTSKINKVFCRLDVSMSKIMLETDKLHVVKFGTSTVHTAFDDATAADEISTLNLQEVIELDRETTDRQTFPLWNDVDLHDYKSNAGLDMPAETPGLDSDLEIEGINFSPGVYYDCLQFHTTGDKLRKIMTPLKWHTLTRTHPAKSIYFVQQSNTKYMNPFAFLAAFIHVPQVASSLQFHKAADTTIETCTLEFSFRAMYNEYNHEFNHSMI